MATVLGCIVQRHNHWLVLLAALLCGAGSWVTARLFQRTVNTSGTQRFGWQVLTAISAGVAIWCTHFIAMLGFDAGAPVQFDLPLTLVSLLIAVGGSTIGFALTTCRIVRIAPALGGAIVGVAIVLMHYTGMETGAAAIARLTDPEARVSSHYTVDEDGTIRSYGDVYGHNKKLIELLNAA